MNSFKKIVIGLFLFVFLLSCKKENTCFLRRQQTTKADIADISKLKSIPEIMDTLNKYPDLQVYRVVDNKYSTIAHCNIFYKNLQVFLMGYSISKSKQDGTMWQMGYPTAIINLPSYTPKIKGAKAVKIAKKEINFRLSCKYYRLGILDINSGMGDTTKVYRLVWKVADKDENIFVYLDANTGQVYRSFDGTYE